MEQLPEYYTRGSKINGIFHHTLVKRTEKKAMYKVEFEPSYTSEKSLNGYEVFQVRQQKETDMTVKDKNGVESVLHLNAKEQLPSDGSFGKWAWYASDLASAESIYETMHIPESQVDENGQEVARKRGRPKKNA